MLAEMIIDRHATPMLFYRIGGVPGGRADETLRRLGDRITIDDADMMSSDLDNRDAIIVGLDWTFDPNTTGYKDDLVAVDAADLFPNGIDDYFIIGTSAWNGSDNLFY